MSVAYKRVELGGIRLCSVDIALTIQWYEHIPGTYVSDMFYRLYCDNTPQVQKHTHLVHGNISMTRISGTADSHTSARNEIMSPPELIHGNDFQ